MNGELLMPDLPQGTVTFLFTDIEGSTRLWQDHPEAMTTAYARHDAILRGAIAAQDGAVYKTIGDAIQVSFPTAPSAVSAALKAQQVLQAEVWPLPGPLRVRMALHTAAVEPDPAGDYRSPALNRLGRLLAAGHGGQVLISRATVELSRDYLPAHASLRDLGEHQLKDLLQPERIHQLSHPDLASDFPPLITLSTRPHNLPRQPTPFLGRESEVDRVAETLRQAGVQLVTLTGPGGIGKTRLALQAAAELVDVFPGGVWFVPLAALTDSSLVLPAIAEALGMRQEGQDPFAHTLASHLRDTQLLLVLDNLEQMLPAVASVVGDLLTMIDGLTVLATCRSPLRLRAEHELAIAPMALPNRKPPPTGAQLGQYDAVRLFIERAQAVSTGFIVTNDNAPAVAEICHRLDGLPLAIELAAARIRLLPPSTMLRRLEQRLPLLTGGARDLPLRQQTLREAIGWSYDLLAPDEQALFRRLSVFTGGWSFEAAEAIAGSPESGELRLDVLDGMERLAEHSLLRQETTADGEPRFLMLETIREYGLEQLARSDEVDEAHQRHANYYLHRARQADAERKGPERMIWLEHLEREHDNLRGALVWALERDPATAWGIVAKLGGFWSSQGFITEGRTWTERALAKVPDGVEPDDYIEVLNRAGMFAQIQADLEGTERWAKDALVLARRLGNTSQIAFALNGLSIAAEWRGEREHALALLEEAVAVAQEAGHTEEIGEALGGLGYLYFLYGDLERARPLIDEAVSHLRAARPYGELPNALHSLGEVLRASGDLEGAYNAYRESVVLAYDGGLKPMVLQAIEGLAMIAAARGNADRAAHLLGATDAQRTEMGMPYDPSIVEEYDRIVAGVRQALGDALFAATWQAGRLLTMDEAIDEALDIGST
jgi:predicted ATPase/class 3 adenylate cyclase